MTLRPMTRLRAAAAALLLLAAAPAPSAAQPAYDTAAAAPSAAAAAPAALQRSAQVSTPPATLRAYAHVFLAFAIVWGLLFGYALYLGRRMGRLERQVDALGDGTA